MATLLFVTRPEYKPEEIKRRSKDWWSCSSTSRAGDTALIYVATRGICFEWDIRSDARTDSEWKFVCDVRRRETFDPPITIAELKSTFTRKQWPAPHLHFRGFRSITITESIADKIRTLRAANDAAGLVLNQALSDQFFEGALQRVTSNTHERNLKARASCIAIHGTSCTVCGMQFDRKYGPDFAGYIHVHHLVPLAGRSTSYVVDPQADLVPICPNCHAVIHCKDPPYSLSEVRRMLLQQGQIS